MNTDATEILSTLKEAVNQLTAAGAPFELIDRQVDGVSLRCFKQAPTTLRDALAEGRAHGEKVCVTYEDERFSFDELFVMVDKLASHLVNHYEIGKGDRVAIAMRNYPEWMAAYIAAASVGAIVVPLNSWAQPD
jgi:long-chain acyl-CoA synthetase